MLTIEELRARISGLPRVALGRFPTPLEFCLRLTEAVEGTRIFIKRDDCTGLAFGGNKTRQLEFTIGQGIHQGADVLIVGGGISVEPLQAVVHRGRQAGSNVRLPS